MLWSVYFSEHANIILNCLYKYFRLDTDGPSHKKIKVDAETTVQELTTLAQHTSVS